MMNPFSCLLAELSEGPILMRPDAAERLVRVMSMRASGARPERVDADLMNLVGMRAEMDAGHDGPGRICDCAVIDGVGIVPVHGPLMQRQHWLWEWFGFTSYEAIGNRVSALAGSERVRAILLDVDSPGGIVSGCFDAARKLRATARASGKPLIGAANEDACSAAYAMISACDEVYMPETARAGSIGVWTLHVDLTRAFDKDGIDVTMIRAGDRKARGGPYERADKATFAKMQASVENTWDIFAALVGEFRGIGKDAVFALEGDWFDADDCLAKQLVDGVGSFESIFNRARSLAS